MSYLVLRSKLYSFNRFDLFKTVYVLYIVCEIIILYVLSITIVQRRGFLYKALRFIGNYTYGAYLAHFFFLQLCTKFLSLFTLQENTILYSLLLFTITATISISAMVICSALPFHTWITGPSPTTNMKWAKIVLRKNHEKVFKPYL